MYVLRFHGQTLKSSLNILKFLSLKGRYFTIKYFLLFKILFLTNLLSALALNNLLCEKQVCPGQWGSGI